MNTDMSAIFEILKIVIPFITGGAIVGIWKVYRDFKRSKTTDAVEDFDAFSNVSERFIKNQLQLIEELSAERVGMLNLKTQIEKLNIRDKEKDSIIKKLEVTIADKNAIIEKVRKNCAFCKASIGKGFITDGENENNPTVR